jgi:WD40 repeat protein
VGTGSLLLTLEDCSSVAFSKDSSLLISGSPTGVVQVLEPEAGTVKVRLYSHSSRVSQVAFLSGSTRVVDWHHTVWVWDLSTGDGGEVLTLAADTEGYLFSNDGFRMLLISGDDIQVRDVLTGTKPLTLRGHTAPVQSFAFSSDGTRIISGSKDRTIRMWDSLSGAELSKLEGHTCITSVTLFSNNTRIVTISDDGIMGKSLSLSWIR